MTPDERAALREEHRPHPWADHMCECLLPYPCEVLRIIDALDAETARHRLMTESAMRFRRERDEARAEVERLTGRVAEVETRHRESIAYYDARVDRADAATNEARDALDHVRALHRGTHACRDGWYTDDPAYRGSIATRGPCPTIRAIDDGAS